jgi:hypothetical protein
MREFSPPFYASGSGSVPDAVRERGFVVLPPAWAAVASGVALDALRELVGDWEGMPPDPHLKDGGHYRRRRHSSFVVEDATCRQVPHRAHFQPPQYNALHGGMERWFEPMTAGVVGRSSFRKLVVSIAAMCSALAGERPWYVEAHQLRIDVREGIGRPTPEGAHRDGVDFVAVVLIGRNGIKGGETRVFEADAPNGLRFTLTEPWSVLFLDDERVIHESTPIQPAEAPTAGPPPLGHRDTLVLTFRRGGFQDRGSAVS